MEIRAEGRYKIVIEKSGREYEPGKYLGCLGRTKSSFDTSGQMVMVKMDFKRDQNTQLCIFLQ